MLGGRVLQVAYRSVNLNLLAITAIGEASIIILKLLSTWAQKFFWPHECLAELGQNRAETVIEKAGREPHLDMALKPGYKRDEIDLR